MPSDPGLLSRRELLKGTGVLIGSIAATSVLATLAPSRVWALEMNALSQPDGETILAFGQTLYPHKDLPTAVYALLVKDLDAEAAKDPKTAALLHQGCASLNSAAGGNFANASPEKRLAAAKSLSGTPFFAAVRSKCITSLYNNEMAWAHFGYEGPSWPRGYLHRGFNDLAWLPNPPEAASPPPYSANQAAL
ncbi:MAG: twin-arginine translocation signal domain-containing protein [Vulcanimicrobiaceae bacterium]